MDTSLVNWLEFLVLRREAEGMLAETGRWPPACTGGIPFAVVHQGATGVLAGLIR